jgi:hypothetical protein
MTLLFFNPEFALGISENIGGRVKRVKKVGSSLFGVVKCFGKEAE